MPSSSSASGVSPYPTPCTSEPCCSHLLKPHSPPGPMDLPRDILSTTPHSTACIVHQLDIYRMIITSDPLATWTQQLPGHKHSHIGLTVSHSRQQKDNQRLSQQSWVKARPRCHHTVHDRGKDCPCHLPAVARPPVLALGPLGDQHILNIASTLRSAPLQSLTESPWLRVSCSCSAPARPSNTPLTCAAMVS